ncbi:uncharacterized protein LOC129583995 [Paramacrobiotus metropolitanus]|uniref:uncharacterized protein LOC129583995 n=1 Tax=Paramacrobiotus metropolitanus TaxID=2943436 RepID=UPI00244574B2|nr:uncharacterized protein LOC129583995 [Paramacrobiotus metropolitanus]
MVMISMFTHSTVSVTFGVLLLSYALPVAVSQALAFSSPSYTFSVASDVKLNTAVGVVSVNYPSATVWTIVYATNNFAINYLNGTLITTNYLQPCSLYNVIVRASNAQRGNPYTNVAVQTSCPNSAISIPAFDQPTGYSISVGNGCPINSYVGVVTAARATNYSLASPYFNINPFSGQITLTNAPPNSPTVVNVIAANSAGSRSVPVTLYTAGCTGVSTGISPTFSQNAYAFTATNCVSGSIIGRVTATSTSGAVTYSLGGSPYFTINSSGVISVSGIPPISGTTQTVEVYATNTSNGKSSMVPVMITIPVLCNGSQSGPDIG